jgi:phosphoglycerate dehydrogenase-like enzyme
MSSPPEISTVLCTFAWKPAEIDQLRRAFAPAEFIACKPSDKVIITDTLQRAEIALLGTNLSPEVLDGPHVRWVHCDMAGLNGAAKPETFAKGLIVSGSAGRSGPALAQHAFNFALTFIHDSVKSLARQRAHLWEGAEAIRERRTLWGQKLGIVGFGYTGKEMARIGRAMGMHVTVLRRSPGGSSSDVDVMLSTENGDGLDAILECDVVMLAMGLSDETHHLFGKDQFKRMKKDSIIINMARGESIDEEALIDALQSGEIAGAGLDVFEVEPLPRDSPLWDMPNVLVTPHATPSMPDKTQRSIDVIVTNLKHYKEGRPLINTIDERDIYTKG